MIIVIGDKMMLEVECNSCKSMFSLVTETLILHGMYVYYYACKHCEAHYVYDLKTSDNDKELKEKRAVVRHMVKRKATEREFKKLNNELENLIVRNIQDSVRLAKENESLLKSIAEIVYLPLLDREVINTHVQRGI
jgi:transposase-like protein